MQRGDLIDGRFEIELLAGAGGMGEVYRARDRETGETVALKTTGARARDDAERFLREARLLADLAHPAIVRYVAHGASAEGVAWLAMEWLDGEDLSARLARAPLGVEESLALGSRVAAALASAHARGVVHRDVKPQNVFLVGGAPARATVLDFGLARAPVATQRLTATGAVLGTVGYMAPEQARPGHVIDARADVFSLGCVLFECLTGHPAFVGKHAVAVLDKLLHQEPPRLADVRPDLPAALDALVSRMLSKERADRPSDAGEVARALAEVAHAGTAAAEGPSRPAPSEAERRLASVVVVELGQEQASAESALRITPRDAAAGEALAAVVAAHGGVISPLAGGALLVTLGASPGGLDGAARAAELAIALRDALPEARIALATGQAKSTDRGLFGQVIERAARLLEGAGRGAGLVRVDDDTRGLLDARYELRERDGVLDLVARREDASAERGRIRTRR